jgi:hypothetical protein
MGAYNHEGSFSAIHQRLRKIRGLATNYACVDCGKPAQHWSYDHACPDERRDFKLGLPFSIDLDHYQPRCVPCHKRLDLAVGGETRLKIICPVCLGEASVQGDGSVGSHLDTAGRRCVMIGRQAPSWDEQTTRLAVGNRSGGICEWCAKARAAEVHHRVSRGAGGRWTPAGTCHLCHDCHARATVNPEWAYGLGLSVRSCDDPEKVPIIREDLTSFQPTSFVSPPRRCRGERVNTAKLTAEDVVDIRTWWAEGVSQRELGRQYGVSKGTIAAIVKGKSWRHVL